MLKYLIKRILLIIPIMMCVVLIVYALLYTTVGANKNALSSSGGGDFLDSIFEKCGIENTFFAKYLRYCYNVLIKLDFGKDKSTSMSVNGLLKLRVKQTLKLTYMSFITVIVFGIVIGMLCALNQNSWFDHTVTAIITFISSVPSYTVAIVLVLLFCLELRWLPCYGFTRRGAYVLPVMTLSFTGIASTARLTRSSVIEVLGQQYVTALRAKGLKERSVIYVHVLKNSLVTVIANLNLVVTQLLCGSFVVERFFSIPGLGYFLLNAVSSRSYTVVMGVSVLYAYMLTAVNIITDMLYLCVNPQMRALCISGGKGGRA